MFPKVECGISSFKSLVCTWQLFSMLNLGLVFFHGTSLIFFTQKHLDIGTILKSNLPYMSILHDIIMLILIISSLMTKQKLSNKSNLSKSQNNFLFWTCLFTFIFGLTSIILYSGWTHWGYLEKEIFNKNLYKAMNTYPGNALSPVLDRIQAKYFCCGVNGYQDWNNRYIHIYNRVVPLSCCVYKSSASCNLNKIDNETSSKYWKEGCSKIYSNTYEKEIYSLKIFGILICVLSIIYSIGDRFIQTGESFMSNFKYICWILGHKPILHNIYVTQERYEYRDPLSPEPDFPLEVFPTVNQLDALRVVREIRENYYKPNIISVEKINET